MAATMDDIQQLVNSGILCDKGVFVFYGVPGRGKSMEAARCFQNSIHLASSPNVLKWYYQWLLTDEAKKEGAKPPKREILFDVYATVDSWSTERLPSGKPKPVVLLDANGEPTYMPTKPRIEATIASIVKKALKEAATGQPLTYANLIIDETGTFWARVFEEFLVSRLPGTVTNDGRVNPLGTHNVLAKWSRDVVDLARQACVAGMNVCLIAHDAEPDPGTGKKGGPKFPNKAVMGQLCADADGVLLREVEDQFGQQGLNLFGSTAAAPAAPASPVGFELAPAAPTPAPVVTAAQVQAASRIEGIRRIWRVHGTENQLSKIRGIPDSMFEAVKDMRAADILQLAAYKP